MDEYKKSLKCDINNTQEYYKKSIVKTEQQKMLESLLRRDNDFISSTSVADIACGGGR